MSYLDLPRLHFSGLFFTGPSTINNITQNYLLDTQLENSADQYDPNAAGWNPTGVAQWWLEECTVLSAVDHTGAAVTSTDVVIGAAVETPSPKTPIIDGTGGFYDIAKMVDLDPDQQGRSALYGVRISVVLPNGAGLQGVMTIPELRHLHFRIAGASSSWGAVGNWMGTLEDVQWSGDISASTILTALQAASAQGLAVKLTVDLHQNNPANVFTTGDLFCYGRILGSIGPALVGELAQVAPGRCLQYVPISQNLAMASDVQSGNRIMQARERVVAETEAIGAARDALTTEAATAAPPDPWNPAFAVIRQGRSRSLLSIDIGGSILLNTTQSPTDPSGLVSDGTFEVDSGITVGVFDLTSNKFVPFTSGALSFVAPNQYQSLVSTPKNCMLVMNSGVFTIPLTTDETNSAKANPLGIQVKGTTVAQEFDSGLWMDVGEASGRLECGSGQTGKTQIMVRQFGKPVVGKAPPVTSVVQLVEWTLDPSTGWNNQLITSTDVGLSIGQTDANGLADITTTVNVSDITLPAIRQPLDSQIYYILLSDPQGNFIGDGPPVPPFSPAQTLSILLWKAFQAPANPTWSDIGAIFSAYARLYPGMKSRLDISDQQTVIGFAPAVLAHMNISVNDPAYMPVTRDLSPSKMNMIVSWLANLVQQSAGSGS